MISKIINAILAVGETKDSWEFTSKDIAELEEIKKMKISSPVMFGKYVAKSVGYLISEGYNVTVVSVKPIVKYKITFNEPTLEEFEEQMNSDKSYKAEEKITDDVKNIRKSINEHLNNKENVNYRMFGTKPKNLRKFLVISDLHIPFELQGIDKLVSELSPDYDGLIINGDFLDTFSMSNFSKEADIPLYEEVIRGLDYLSQWVGLYDKVVFNKGNHEMRIENYIGKNDKFNRLRFMSDFDVLSYLVEQLQLMAINENYKSTEKQIEAMANMIDKVVYTHSTAMKIGNAIIAHPTTFSSVPSRTITMAIDNYTSRFKDVDAVIIGHTHHTAKIIRNGVLGIESGCLCGTLPYELKGNIRLTQPTTGFAVLVQKDGKTDMNATSYYTLEGHISRSNSVVNVSM
jgi:predicted phosphodiesterase